MNKFAFVTLLLVFAVFFNSIELGRSQQRDPESTGPQGTQAAPLGAPGTQRHPLLRGSPLPPHYVSAERRRQYGLPEPQGRPLGTPAAPLGAPGPHSRPILRGPPLPPHYVSAERRRQYGLPEPQARP